MGVILDSCVWIALAVNRLDRQMVIDAAEDDLIFTSVISLGELRFGVETCTDAADRAARAAYLRQVEARPSLNITNDTAAAFGVLAAAVKQSGRSPRPRYNDLWIAAQAIENNYSLLTLNKGDFVRLPGLRLLALPAQTYD